MGCEKKLKTNFGILKEYFRNGSFKIDHPYHVNVEESIDAVKFYLCFVELMGYEYEEIKEGHWEIPFCFENEYFIAFKFGWIVEIYSSAENINKEKLERMEKKITDIIKLSEGIMSLEKETKINSNEVIMLNNYTIFRNRYMYFRKQADFYFKKQSTAYNDDDVAKFFANYLTECAENSNVGNYNAQAMIDAFFSYNEHVLVLLLGFREKQLETTVKEFILANWTKKIEIITSKKRADSHFNGLDKIKILRNVFAHGGFEKEKEGGNPYFIKLFDMVAVPVNLSDFSKSIVAKNWQIDYDEFEKICKELDGFEAYIDCEFKNEMSIIKSGLNIDFSEGSRKEYQEAIKTVEDTGEFIKRMHDINY